MEQSTAQMPHATAREHGGQAAGAGDGMNQVIPNLRWALLGEECQIVGGGTPSRTEVAFFDGDIPWATPTDVTGMKEGMFLRTTKENITQKGLDKSSARLLPSGTVLLTSRATIGFTAIAEVPMATNQGFANFICGPNVLPEFLAHWLPTQRERMLQLAGGTTFKEISKGTLKTLRLPLPSLDEQRRIVDILNHAANIRRLREEARAKAREIIPALFVEMFGDPATNPKGWPKTNVGEVTDVQGGLQLTKKRDTLPLEMPYLRVANVHRNLLVLDEIKTIRVTEAEKERVKLRGGDLLIVEGHGNPEEIGRVAVWDGSIPECLHQNHLIRSRCREGVITPKFLSAFLNSQAGRQHLLRQGKTTSGLNTISTSNVKCASILLPPIALQQKFAERVAEVESISSLNDRAATAAEQMAQSLLAQVFGQTA